MPIQENIILAIGTKQIGGFTELKSAIDLIGKLYSKVEDTTKELDAFSQMWRRTNQNAVIMADNAAKGLINTVDIIKGWNKLFKSGANVTDEQFKILAVRAADLAQATGVDATQAFVSLTDSISKGTSRALRDYGVKVTESIDMEKTRKEMLEALTKGYEKLRVEMETGTERMYSLRNNLGTMVGLMYDAVGASNTLGKEIGILNTAVGDFNLYLAQAPNTMGNYITSMKFVKQAAKELTRTYLELFMKINPITRAWLWLEQKIQDFRPGGGVTDKGPLQSWIDNFMKTSPGEQADFDDLYLKMKAEIAKREKEGVGKGDMMRGGRFLPSGKGGGGGGGYQEPGGKFGGLQRDLQQIDQGSFYNPYSGEYEFGFDSDLQLAEKNVQAEIRENIREREIENRKRLAEQRKQEAEEAEKLRRKELEQARQLREEWASTFETMSYGAAQQSKWAGALVKATGTAIRAFEEENKSAAATIISLLADVGSAISQEATWQAIMEAARAIASAAKRDWRGAILHGAAAAAFAVVAATAGRGGKGGGQKIPRGNERLDQRFSGHTPESWGQASETRETKVTIQLREGTDGLFKAVVEQNNRASMSGQSHFSKG